MDDSILKDLDGKVTNIGTSDVYKKKVGGILLWLSPLSYTDQKFVQEALENEDSSNNVNDAKLTALSRSIVGIDKLDLRKYRNGENVFPSTAIKDGKRIKVKVNLAKYLETKILNWGQEFVDLAFEVFADISETSRKKFAKEVVLENTKEPRVELAELEVKVHELRARLSMPVLVEKPGSSYKNLQGEPSQETLDDLPNYDHKDDNDDSPEPPDGLEDVLGAQAPSFDEEDEEVEEESEDTTEEEESVEEDDDGTEVEEVSSEAEILGSVDPPDDLIKPNISIPSPIPIPPPQADVDPDSPIQKMMANRKPAKAVRGVPANAISSPDRPLEPSSALNPIEVIESAPKRPDRPTRLNVDPPASKQSINPRFKQKR